MVDIFYGAYYNEPHNDSCIVIADSLVKIGEVLGYKTRVSTKTNKHKDGTLNTFTYKENGISSAISRVKSGMLSKISDSVGRPVSIYRFVDNGRRVTSERLA